MIEPMDIDFRLCVRLDAEVEDDVYRPMTWTRVLRLSPGHGHGNWDSPAWLDHRVAEGQSEDA
jgi:hypothetical protein